MYTLEFEKPVKKDFKNINISDIRFIKESLYDFVENFSYEFEQEFLKIGKIKKLQGVSEELYRLKLRSYRVIYKKEEEKLIILVVSVKSREKSYKR
ncbi:type II toxin-antitoxin system RelE family toxin [Arcobacter sp.]|uniref:type II toxin-antitoxin system RelE family toxin n=1 Tax=Arcobacter sp. TaxID=1872629 RepID=UPI003D0D8895